MNAGSDRSITKLPRSFRDSAMFKKVLFKTIVAQIEVAAVNSRKRRWNSRSHRFGLIPRKSEETVSLNALVIHACFNFMMQKLSEFLVIHLKDLFLGLIIDLTIDKESFHTLIYNFCVK